VGARDRARLVDYRAKRDEWLRWYELREDEPHSIQQQVFSMIFLDMAYRILAEAYRTTNKDLEVAANGLLAHLLDQGYVATQVLGKDLSDAAFFPVFERMANHYRLPVWMHPLRQQSFPDYRSEPKSRYEIWQVLGWPYETSAAMARIVFSGLFDRLPELRIITHHCGGMLPYFAGRAETLWAQLGSRTADEDYSQLLKRMTKPLIEYFRMFYGDTVLGGSASALRCGLDFFGADRVVFASDCPFDPEGGAMFIREGIRSIADLGLPLDVERKIYYANAVSLMRLPPPK